MSHEPTMTLKYTATGHSPMGSGLVDGDAPRLQAAQRAQ
jgi:hypothetical protein